MNRDELRTEFARSFHAAMLSNPDAYADARRLAEEAGLAEVDVARRIATFAVAHADALLDALDIRAKQSARAEEPRVEDHREYMRAQELANALDLPISSVYDLARKGRIPGTVHLGQRVRFDRKKVEAWLDSGGHP